MNKKIFSLLNMICFLFIFGFSFNSAATTLDDRASLLEQVKQTLTRPLSETQAQTIFNTLNRIQYETYHDIEDNHKKLQEISNTLHGPLSSQRLQPYVQQLETQKKILTENIASMTIILYEIKSLKTSMISATQKINPYNLQLKNTESLPLQWHSFSLPSLHLPSINSLYLALFFFYIMTYFSLHLFANPSFIKEKLTYAPLIKKYFFHGLILFILCYGLFHAILSNTQSVPIQWVNFRPTLYTLIVLFISVYLLNRKIKSQNEILIQTLLFRLRICLLMLMIIGVFSLFISFLTIPFLKTIFIFGYITGLFWIISAFYNQTYLQKHPFIKKIIGYASVLIYGLLLFTTGLGYQQLGLWFIPNLFMSLMVFFFSYSLNEFLIQMKNYLTHSNHKIMKKIYHFFGLKKEQTLIEIFILRYVLFTGLMVYTLIVFSEIWGITPYQIHEFMNIYYINHLFKFNIVLLLRSIILFCLFMLIGRVIAGMIVRPIKNKQTQEAARFCIQSIGLLLNVIMICFILNINITAMIAISTGLSIGLGFGLQRFASDMAYGLYINLTKMFQPGDRVRVPILYNPLDGIIKKIGLLFTQITTTEHSDLFIPNGKICEQGVINYTYQHNTLHLFTIKFSLDTMSEAEKAKEILLKIVKKKSTVLQEKQYEPTVELIANHLVLECAIKDISLKNQIMTDLELSILKEFNKKNIAIQLV